ncbi:MAG: hypothetical protein ACOCRL_01470 [Bacillota bacterium]
MFRRPPRERDRRRDPDECPWRPPDGGYYPGPDDNHNPGHPGRTGIGVSPDSIARCVYPAVNHGIEEANETDIMHAMMEAVMMGYLMGMGFNYNTAYNTVEYWEHEGIIDF